MSNNDDLRYCKEISRKAVARAALHLGVKKMDNDALCVVADSLIYYLERIGNILTDIVQKSNRTSAHCNVLDVLQAVDVCTAPIARQITMRGRDILELSKNEAEITKFGASVGGKCIDSEYNECGWESLAHFLFGENWLSIPLVGFSEISVDDTRYSIHSKKSNNIFLHESHSDDTGMKTITKATCVNLIKDGKNKEFGISELKSSFPLMSSYTKSKGKIYTRNKGWYAPFIGTIPLFPLSKSPSEIANPHKLPSSISSSFHCWLTNEDVCGVDFYRHPSRCQKQPVDRSLLSIWNGDTLIKEFNENTSCISNMFCKNTLSRGDISVPLIMTEKTAELENVYIPQEYSLHKNTNYWGSICAEDKTKRKQMNFNIHEVDLSNAVLSESRGNSNKRGACNKRDAANFDLTKPLNTIDIYEYPNDSSINIKKMKKIKVNSSKNGRKKSSCANTYDFQVINESELFGSTYRKPRYVPSFYPPFPSEYNSNHLKKLKSNISLLNIITDSVFKKNNVHDHLNCLYTSNSRTSLNVNNKGSYQGIRSSLVSLERQVRTSHWGTSCLGEHTLFRREGVKKTMNISSLLNKGYSSSVGSGKILTQIKKEPSIVPLGKASGSRISRILEGSMDL